MTARFALRKNPRLYEVNTLVWLNDLARRFSRPVTLDNVPETVWDEFVAAGFDLVWLMGVWERSPTSAALLLGDDSDRRQFDAALPGWTAAQVAGSPYSIHRYEPDRRIGTWAGLDAARGALHQRGMGLMLDFVGNHTALDHPWTREHPEYYIQGGEADLQRDPASYWPVQTAAGKRAILARGRDPNFPAWDDVAQLDYFSPDTRAAMLGELRKIAGHCDALRCDVAMLLLNDVFARTWSAHLAGRAIPAREFWAEAVEAAPGTVWLAEVYWGLERRLLELGFQFAYDKTLYDLLRGGDAAGAAGRLRSLEAMQPHLAHFLENHDEERAANVFGGPSYRLQNSDATPPGAPDNEPRMLAAAATLTATLPGIRFFHQGQMAGRKVRQPIGLTEQSPDSPATCDAAIAEFYQKLMGIVRAPIFHDGAWRLLEVTSDTDGTFANLSAYQWELGDELWVIVANPGEATAQGRVHFPAGSPAGFPMGLPVGAGSGIEAGRQYLFADELNGPKYLRDGTEIASRGLYVRLDGFQAHVFWVQSAGPDWPKG